MAYVCPPSIKFKHLQKQNKLMSKSMSNLGAGITNSLPINRSFTTSLYGSNKMLR